MKITLIENDVERSRIIEFAKTSKFLLFPLFNDNIHPIKAEPILILAKPLGVDELFVIGISHSELINQYFPFDIFKNAFIYNKKYWTLKNSIDIDTLYYTQNKEYTINLFKSQHDWITYPIYKIVDGLIETIQEFNDICSGITDITPAIRFINDITIPSLAQVESHGIRVDGNFAQKELIYDGYVYSQYNHLTMTGRPSNRYGGVNYSALNKSDGSRKPFISRFEDGQLFLLDYDSYHLRLIAKLINYELPKDSVHTHFAKQYFQTEDITPEMYDESKKISFQMLYGGLQKQYEHVAFFRAVQVLIDEMWDSHKQNGFIPSIVSGIHITADNKMKLFNYLIQNYETEQNMMVLRKIFLDTFRFKSVPILYTYDSIIFDVKGGETEEYLHAVKTIMELNGKFPVKTSYGKNYDEMIKL